MLPDLQETIRQMQIQQGRLDFGEVHIARFMPTRDWAAGISQPTADLDLYHIRENMGLTNPLPSTVRPGPNNTAIKSCPDYPVGRKHRDKA